MTKWSDLFTRRQLVALETFSDLVPKLRNRTRRDAMTALAFKDNKSLDDIGAGATEYADSISLYLGIAISRISSYWSSFTTHDTSREKITSVYARQAIPMVWDFMEGNPFSSTSGNFLNSVKAAANLRRPAGAGNHA